MQIHQETLEKKNSSSGVTYIQNSQTASMPADDEINLSEMLGAVFERKLMIAVLTLLGMFLGSILAISGEPVYKATAMLQVEEDSGLGLGAFEDLMPSLGGESEITANLEIVRSRMVVAPVVKELGLDIVITPNYYPIFGSFLARKFSPTFEEPLAKSFFGLSGYAWGGEIISLEEFSVPEKYLGDEFKLEVIASGFSLYSPNNERILTGKVGDLVYSESLGKSLSGDDLFVKIKVDKLLATEGTTFTLIAKAFDETVEGIINSLSANEKSKKSGVISLSFSHNSKVLAKDVVNKIAQSFYQQDLSRTSAEAESSIKFLEKQLPVLKQKLDASEAAYNAFRVKAGSINIEEEAKNTLSTVVNLEAGKLELEQKIEELRFRFKADHPAVLALNSQLKTVRSKLSRLNTRIDAMPDAQQKLLRLARDVEVNNALYTKLLATSQELNVAKASSVGSVRIIDLATSPREPVKPNRPILFIGVTLAALFLGVILSLMMKREKGIEDPAEIEKEFGISVLTSILHSNDLAKITRENNGDKLPLLNQVLPQSVVVEGFRSLRTMMQFSLVAAKNNITLVTGPSPGVGKSFVSMHLAAALADTGKKVLVIDADFRRGILYRYLGVRSYEGLYESLTDKSVKLYPVSKPNLYLMPTGHRPENSTEVINSQKFGQLINALSKKFDHIIIDTPPILAVSDSVLIAKYVGTVLFVIKHRQHPVRELQQAIKPFQQAGVKITGIVMNDVKKNKRFSSNTQYVYQYDYQ